jgi:ABC-type branched-subunit amino acid transport system ATPase component
MLEFTNISKRFDGVKAVQNVSLSIKQGEITSLIGPNGAGKTTLFNIATGFIKPDHGELAFKHCLLNDLAPWRIARQGIARTFQNLRIFTKLTLLENVLLGMKLPRGERLLYAMFRFSNSSVEHKENLNRAQELLDFAGLLSYRNELADNLSYGQQKLLSIACCMAGDPELLLLDEPVAGVQPEMIRRIEALLKQLVDKHEKTVLLIEHDIEFVLRISDTVVVMDDGRKIVEGEPESIRNDAEILEAYLS